MVLNFKGDKVKSLTLWLQRNLHRKYINYVKLKSQSVPKGCGLTNLTNDVNSPGPGYPESHRILLSVSLNFKFFAFLGWFPLILCNPFIYFSPCDYLGMRHIVNWCRVAVSNGKSTYGNGCPHFFVLFLVLFSLS